MIIYTTRRRKWLKNMMITEQNIVLMESEILTIIILYHLINVGQETIKHAKTFKIYLGQWYGILVSVYHRLKKPIGNILACLIISYRAFRALHRGSCIRFSLHEFLNQLQWEKNHQLRKTLQSQWRSLWSFRTTFAGGLLGERVILKANKEHRFQSNAFGIIMQTSRSLP